MIAAPVVTEYSLLMLIKLKRFMSRMISTLLSRGLLALAILNGEYALIPAPVAVKIAERKPESIVVRNEKSEEVSAEEEDWYADFQIPDDLMCDEKLEIATGLQTVWRDRCIGYSIVVALRSRLLHLW